MKEKKTYYIKGRYYSPQDNTALEYIQNNAIKRRQRLITLAICIIGVSALLKLTIYTPQYHWSNDLVWAIKKQNVTKIQRLLKSEEMDVNKPGGVEFPAYLIGLSENSRNTPLEEACWVGDYGTVKMLINRGADARIGEVWSLTLTEYGGEDYNILKLLLKHGADANQNIEDSTAPLLHIAAWSPTEEAQLHNMKAGVVAKDIKDIYKLVMAHSSDQYPVDEVSGDTPLSLARAVNNQILIKFLEGNQRF